MEYPQNRKQDKFHLDRLALIWIKAISSRPIHSMSAKYGVVFAVRQVETGICQFGPYNPRRYSARQAPRSDKKPRFDKKRNEVQMKHHSSRVAGLVSAMCHCLGLDRRSTDGIVLSAHVHDIGKWALPSSALSKSGPLQPEEWRQVRQHTKLGAEMLEAAGLHEAADVALRHHEAWDGSGYPDGVRGESIPFAARVVAVCDVYSALRENRPYRAGLTHDEAMKIITHGDPQGRTRPEMFDPRLLFLFVEHHHRMAELFEAVGRVRHLARPTPISHACAPLLASIRPVAVDV